MNAVRVKICGITRIKDAVAAVDAGADALGFMFYEPSPRFVSPHTAAEIIRELPPFVARVGVFVDAAQETVERAIEVCGLDTLQFHGDESPDFCERFALKAIKAFRVRGPETLEQAKTYKRAAWLLDAHMTGQLGGTGTTFDWALARRASRYNRMIILAGGLSPANVEEAVRQVKPYAVDVSSGVESTPGKKSQQKMRFFISAAKAASFEAAS